MRRPASRDRAGSGAQPGHDPEGVIVSDREVFAATGFFTTEVWTLRGLVTCHVLFFIDLASRKVHVAGSTPRPHQEWTRRIARDVTQGLGNLILEPLPGDRAGESRGRIRRRKRLGGLLSLSPRSAAWVLDPHGFPRRRAGPKREN